MSISVRNPRSGEADYQITPPTSQALRKQASQMRKAQKNWQQVGVEARIEALQTWKKVLEKYEDSLIEALSKDTGRRAESILEVQLLSTSIDRWCGIARDFFQPVPRKQASIPFIEIAQDLMPYPLVGVISPWNFPLLLSIIDTLPALLAGCAVMVKPSEITPRFVEPLLKSLTEVPALSAVFTYINGAGETGAQLVDTADLICFTGSVATGRKVYDAASRNFIPVFLELGGKDAAIVLEGADLAQATSALLWGSVVNAGQSCLSIERVYVQESIFADFVAQISQKARALKLAYPNYDSGQIGPIISEAQAQIIQEHLDDALAKGAKLEAGSGKILEHGGGKWLEPTVLTKVNHQMKVMTEETFGPIIPIMPIHDAEEGITQANSTIYGLSAAVFAKDQQTALAVGQQLEAGAISINEAALTAMIHEGEKNAFKYSGIGGTRMGASAIKRFMRQKAFLIKAQSLNSPWWFDAQP